VNGPREHTAPTPEEVARLVDALPSARRWAAATAPSEDEIARVSARRVPVRGVRWQAPGLVIALAAALFLVVRATPPPRVIGAPVGQVIDVTDALVLDGTWSVQGHARLRLAHGTAGALEVELGDGDLTFVASGAGTLRVDAEGGTVSASSGRFLVHSEGPALEVSVLAGVVDVVRPPHGPVSAGTRWTSVPPTRIVSVAPSRAVQRPRAVVPVPTAAPPPPPDPALVAAGLFARRDAGDAAADLAPLVSAWLAANQGHALAPEVAYLQLELTTETEAPDVALHALDAWLAANPTAARRADVHWLRAGLAEERLHDCAVAASSYRWLAEQGPPGARGEARRRLEACGR
jgi:hypothetical protein